MVINIYIDFKLSKEINLIIKEYQKRLKPLHGGIGVKLTINYFKSFEQEKKINFFQRKDILVIKITNNDTTFDSYQFADFLQNQLVNNKEIIFLITENDYYSENNLSLTTIKLTTNSQLILLVEQIYRSTTIWNNTKYHK